MLILVYFTKIEVEKGKKKWGEVGSLLSRFKVMQKHRIFIAINLPENIRNRLVREQEETKKLFESSPEVVRWTKADNLHITLEFIGYVNNDDIMEIFNIAKRVTSKKAPFLVNLNKICYGPLDKKNPRMVWVIGEKSKEFASLRDDLEEALSLSPENRQNLLAEGRERKFSPHITLGRIRQWEWKRIEPEERPIIDKEINMNFEANSVEVMESQLKRGGPEYTVLESLPLTNKL